MRLAGDVPPTARTRIPTRQSARLCAIGAVALAVLFSLALAPRAEALIYWSSFGDRTIGRANLDGTGVDQTFIGTSSPTGLAVDAAHVYWADAANGSIGRANLDGTGVDQSFIADADLPTAVAVDDAHAYWANWGTDSIGRANLDGTGVDQNFIAPAISPFGVAVDDAHVYWPNMVFGGPDSIGRANLDGTGVDQSFIGANVLPRGLAVDDAHVYWANPAADTGSIGRANLDGTGVDPSYIAGVSAGDVAVDATHVYWSSTNSIGRANLDGTGVDHGFVTGAGDGWAVAVDSLAFVSFVKVTKNERRGTATITAKVPVPGELELAKTRLVKGTNERAEVAGNEQLSIKPRRKAKQKLAAKGRTKVKAKVTYTPDGGEPDTRSKRIQLIKR